MLAMYSGRTLSPGIFEACPGLTLMTMWKGRLSGWATGEDRRREFEEVALVHLGAIYRTALRLTHNRAEAEDLTQDTCLRAFRGFHRFDPGTNCRAWLFTILRNAFRDRLRRRHHELLDAESAAWDGGTASVPRGGMARHPLGGVLLAAVPLAADPA